MVSTAKGTGLERIHMPQTSTMTQDEKNAHNNRMPSGISNRAKKAYEIIMTVLRKYNALDTGGCQSFYSPKEWQKRGEKYGCESELLVVYDGGDLRPFFSMDACYDLLARPGTKNCYALYEEMQDALKAEGFYFEECTGWYSCVVDTKKGR